MINRIKIAIIGLGYVGLPLAVGFSRKFKVIGYDYNAARVQLLKKGIDSNNTKKKSFFYSGIYLVGFYGQHQTFFLDTSLVKI